MTEYVIIGGSHHGEKLEQQTFEVVHLIHKEDWDTLNEQLVQSERQNPDKVFMRTEIYKLQILELFGRECKAYVYTSMTYEQAVTAAVELGLFITQGFNPDKYRVSARMVVADHNVHKRVLPDNVVYDNLANMMADKISGKAVKVIPSEHEVEYRQELYVFTKEELHRTLTDYALWGHQ